MPDPHRGSVRREVQTIGRSFALIARALERLAPMLAARSGSNSGNPTSRGRKLKLSPKRRAALKLQGQYVGHLRNLKRAQKTRVKAARTAKGVRADIALAKGLTKR